MSLQSRIFWCATKSVVYAGTGLFIGGVWLYANAKAALS